MNLQNFYNMMATGEDECSDITTYSRSLILNC